MATTAERDTDPGTAADQAVPVDLSIVEVDAYVVAGIEQS